MEYKNQNQDNDSIVNYLLLIKNGYNNLILKNEDFTNYLAFDANKQNPYNIEIPLDIRLLLNSNRVTDIYVKQQEIKMLLKSQIEKIDELLDKYCEHEYVEDTIETKSQVLIDVEYCARCYLNKE